MASLGKGCATSSTRKPDPQFPLRLNYLMSTSITSLAKELKQINPAGINQYKENKPTFWCAVSNKLILDNGTSNLPLKLNDRKQLSH